MKMLDVLLESKRKKQGNLSGSLTSAVIHVVLVTAAVVSSSATAIIAESKQDEVNYVAPEKKEPPPPDKPVEPPPQAPNTPPPPKGFQTLTAPIEIPTVIPTIDLTARVTNELDFSGKGVQGGVAAGTVGGTGKVDTDQPFFSYEVEKMARFLDGPSPVYPSILKQTKQTGKVLVQFVVDTAGKADMGTFKIVESTNPLFDIEVRKVLPRYRFAPAEIGSRKVPMYVQLPFEFKLEGGEN
jgi:protein TonB